MEIKINREPNKKEGITKTKMLIEEGLKLYFKFAVFEGAKHIAKPPSLQALINWCKKHDPRYILEIGAGIGCITYALLKYSNARVDTYEESDFCVKQLFQNLEEFSTDRFTVLTDYRKMPPQKEYDLLIIDGGAGGQVPNSDVKDFGNPGMLLNILENIKVNTIYVEGLRKRQQNVILNFLKKGDIVKWKIDQYSPGTLKINFMGGYLYRKEDV